MDTGVVVITFFRSLISLVILKFPLFGGILAIVADYVDLEILKFLGNNLSDYQQIDKILDMFYLSLELLVVLKWKNILAKNSAIFLFIYRVIGFLLFIIFKSGIILFIFPNLFEFFYLFYLSFKKLHKFDPVTSIRNLIIILLLLLPLKLYFEYMLHINTTLPWIENKYVKMFLK